MNRLVVIFVALLGWAVGLSGCKDKFVPFVVDADELKRFIEESETGRQLFMWDSLILPIPYQLPFSSATFRDSVIDHERTYIIAVPDTLDSLPTPLNRIRHARTRVQDRFTVRTEKVLGTDTIIITADRIINRLGWFYKLGNDYEPYVGWYLWYYQGQDSAFVPRFTALMRFPNQTPFAVDPTSPIKINVMRIIDDGSTVILDTKSSNPTSNRQPTPIITFAGEGGFGQRQMIRVDRLNYTDTLKTPTINPRIWNLIFVQSFHDDEFFFTGGFCIPYRVPQ